jgi:hypothetical protein
MRVFAVKTDAQGAVKRFKAHYVAKGFAQRPNVEYHGTYAPTWRTAILLALFALAAHYRWEIWGFDVSTAFLNGKLNEELYMQPPPGETSRGYRLYR